MFLLCKHVRLTCVFLINWLWWWDKHYTTVPYAHVRTQQHLAIEISIPSAPCFVGLGCDKTITASIRHCLNEICDTFSTGCGMVWWFARTPSIFAKLDLSEAYQRWLIADKVDLARTAADRNSRISMFRPPKQLSHQRGHYVVITASTTASVETRITPETELGRFQRRRRRR